MKLTKTDKYRVIEANPWLGKNSIVEDNPVKFGCVAYPHLFAPIYEFENDVEVCQNDIVYRIVTKGYDKTVKSIKLQELHITGNLEVFPTRELAEEKLKQEEKQSKTRMEESNLISTLQNIQVISNLKDFDSLSLAEIKKKFENINKLANVWKQDTL